MVEKKRCNIDQVDIVLYKKVELFYMEVEKGV